MPVEIKQNHFTATRNACKLCAPLGASLVFRGIKNVIPLIHGSQGCSTYIRRYLISHYREPVDIASSNFTEESTIFGGKNNLLTALDNIMQQYRPEGIGIATSCLAETIGEDISLYLKEFIKDNTSPVKLIVSPTPSYQGTHIDGFYKTVKAVTEQVVLISSFHGRINLFPGLLSCEDIRHLKEIINDFGVGYTVLPDYSETLDGPICEDYYDIPEGGTAIKDLEKMSGAPGSIEFGPTIAPPASAAGYLENEFGVKRYSLFIPLGLRATDELFAVLEEISGEKIPRKYMLQRGRLVDAYVDAHKYLFGKRAVIYGEEDLVISLARFILEIGMIPVLCASGGRSGKMKELIYQLENPNNVRIEVMDGVDFEEIAEAAVNMNPDILIGNSKGYPLSKKAGIPLVRIGFPIHDRIGAGRILSVGYRGTQELFDRIANTVIQVKQDHNPVGYFYM